MERLAQTLVAKLHEPMPMMHVEIPKPGIDVPVYPTGSLALPEPAESMEGECLNNKKKTSFPFKVIFLR